MRLSGLLLSSSKIVSFVKKRTSRKPSISGNPARLPAAMKLLGKWNWYMPRSLAWVPSLGHGESRALRGATS